MSKRLFLRVVDGKQSTTESISSTVSPNFENYQVIDEKVAIEIVVRESKVSKNQRRSQGMSGNIFSKVDRA